MSDVVKLAFGIAIGMFLNKLLEAGLGATIYVLALNGYI